MLFEIINPSDPYTMRAESFQEAAVAICLLGEGRYGLQEIDGEHEVPIFLFGGANEWFTKTFGHDVEDCYKRADWSRIADVLGSVTIGSETDLKIYERTMAALTDPDSREKFAEIWLDERRSSMNNIGRRAQALAKNLREKVEKEKNGKSRA